MGKRPILSLATTAVRLASSSVCLVVVLWFVIFAAGQAGVAAAKQANEIAPTPNLAPTTTPATTTPATTTASPASGGAAGASTTGSSSGSPIAPLKDAIVHAGNFLTKPFSDLSGSHSPWVENGLSTALVLLLYGLGVGFVVRTVRLHV